MADNNAHTVVQLILLFNEQKSHQVILLSIQIEYDLKEKRFCKHELDSRMRQY